MENTLPKNWVEINLKDSVDFRKGKKPKVLAENYFDGSVPYRDIKGLETDTVNFYADPVSAKYFKKNDVVIVWDGSRSGLILKPKEGAIGSTLGALSPYIYKNEYLYYFLLSHYETINSKARGVGIPHVDPTYLWNLSVPLPPLAEQERIVAKLDVLFVQQEIMKKALCCIPALLKDFRQQVLTQAVTGKLTENWREGKDLEEWDYKLIYANREINKAKNKKFTKSKGYFEVPESWCWFRFYDLMNLVTDSFRYGVVQPGDYVNNEQKLIRVQDIIYDKIETEKLRGISAEIDNNYKSARIKLNTILISIVGTIGRTYIVEKDVVGFNIARAIAKVPIEFGDVSFIKYFLDCSFGQKLLNSESREVARKTLNLEQLKNIKIPFPSQSEQYEIVSRVESLFAKADAIEQRYKTLKEKIDQLPQALLHKAFKGELVTQLPIDGDAKDLLQEILALKNESMGKKKVVRNYKQNDEVLGKVAEGNN